MPNIRSIRDVQEENDDEQRQAYYAGGQGQNGGGSGQQILDPTDLMRRAQQDLGAQSYDEFAREQGNTSSFTGSGQTLEGNSVEGQEPEPSYTITFWQNGFSVNDGPLRDTNDPANAAFLAAINKGQVPAELEADAGPGRDVQVHLINKSDKPWTPAPVTLKPFSGSGQSLRGEGSSQPAPVEAPQPAASELIVDEAQPTTRLQVTLHDGSRKVLKLNNSHTVGQLRAHIASLSTSSPFDLMTTFPRKIITDDSQTLAEAGLLNNSIVQALK